MSLLLHGDCLEHLKSVDSDSVDFIFCDLPYGCLNSCKWDIIIPWKPFWDEIMRVKKINTPIFFTTTTKFGVEIINNAPKKCPFRWDIAVLKSTKTGFLTSTRMPLRSHEMIYCFYEKLPFYDLSSHKHKFINEDKVVSYNTVYNNSNKKTTPTTKHPVKGVTTGQPRYDPPLPDSVLEVNYTRGKHSTEKPIALMSWLLKYFSKEGDTVLDPTMGSGSTGVACKNMNRNFIGIEKDPEIYEVAVNRIEN